MHDEALARPQLSPGRIEHVQVCCSLGVEAVRGRSSTHACHDRGAGGQVQPAQSQCGIHLTTAVYAVPDSLQLTIIQLCLQAATSQVCQRLGRRDHTALAFEQPAEL